MYHTRPVFISKLSGAKFYPRFPPNVTYIVGNILNTNIFSPFKFACFLPKLVVSSRVRYTVKPKVKIFMWILQFREWIFRNFASNYCAGEKFSRLKFIWELQNPWKFSNLEILGYIQRRVAAFKALLKIFWKYFTWAHRFNRKSALKKSLEITTYLNNTLNKL